MMVGNRGGGSEVVREEQRRKGGGEKEYSDWVTFLWPQQKPRTHPGLPCG